jgi:hypothetical protein
MREPEYRLLAKFGTATVERLYGSESEVLQARDLFYQLGADSVGICALPHPADVESESEAD